MMYTAIAVVALAALAIAVPTPGGNVLSGQSKAAKYNAIQYTATFDDLQALTQNAALQQTGPYDGLDLKSIDTVQFGVEGTILIGVLPRSYPSSGAYGATAMLTQGEPEITNNYPETVTVYFDFQQFYFGCVAGTVEAVASAPVGCYVTVTGYRESNEVARQSFIFTPGLSATAPMIKATLGMGFKKIDYATFDSTYEVPDAGATLLDDVKYIAYSEPKKGGRGKKLGS